MKDLEERNVTAKAQADVLMENQSVLRER